MCIFVVQRSAEVQRRVKRSSDIRMPSKEGTLSIGYPLLFHMLVCLADGGGAELDQKTLGEGP